MKRSQLILLFSSLNAVTLGFLLGYLLKFICQVPDEILNDWKMIVSILLVALLTYPLAKRIAEWEADTWLSYIHR